MSKASAIAFTAALLISFFSTGHSLDFTSVKHPVKRVTVSGQSAGASMAIQHLFSFSSVVDGAGIAAGSLYGCGSLPHHARTCYYGNANIKRTIEYIHKRRADNLIDDPGNLTSSKVLLFSGKNDWTVYTKAMREVATQLQSFIPDKNIAKSFSSEASHVWSIDSGSCSCGACAYEWGSLKCCDVNNCGYDLSGDMLRLFYGKGLKPRSTATNKYHLISQWEYVPKESRTPHGNLLKNAIAYVPTACEANPAACRIHVNYHGCTDKIWKRRLLWANLINLNEYGEANNIIILYPQAAGDKKTGVGCFNWATYTDDPNFDTRQGIQLRTVVAMIEDIAVALSSAQVMLNADNMTHTNAMEQELLD